MAGLLHEFMKRDHRAVTALYCSNYALDVVSSDNGALSHVTWFVKPLRGYNVDETRAIRFSG